MVWGERVEVSGKGEREECMQEGREASHPRITYTHVAHNYLHMPQIVSYDSGQTTIKFFPGTLSIQSSCAELLLPA